MNEVILKGLLKNISSSHVLNDVEYCKADLIVPGLKGKDNIIDVRFKKCLLPIENDVISLTGTVRSYSKKISENKNQVQIYVFTYFDLPNDQNITNDVLLSGRICKIDPAKTIKSGKNCVHAILANNLILQDQSLKINNYIPIVFWGNLATKAQNLKVSDQILVHGQMHSRTYTKTYEDGYIEIKTAHEVVVLNYEEQF